MTDGSSRVSPIQTLLPGFLGLVAVVAVLLALPIATQPGDVLVVIGQLEDAERLHA